MANTNISDSQIDNLVSLLDGYVQEGGHHLNVNVFTRETLLDAQKHPENHRDLIVRVAGYSAFFNVLSKKTQDDIIELTEQTL